MKKKEHAKNDRSAETIAFQTVQLPNMNLNIPTFSQEFLSGVRDIAKTASKIGRQFQEGLGPVLQQAQENLRPVLEVVSHFAIQARLTEKFDQTGWLPHYSIPSGLVSHEQSDEEFSSEIHKHYTNNWSDAENEFLKRIDKYDLDSEAKETFKEALECHRLKLYRVAPKLLFPEIERLACKEIYGGLRKYSSQDKKSNKAKTVGITSLPDIKEKAGEMFIDEIITNDFGWGLFKKLDQHFYKPIKNQDDIKRIELDPIPNRHAAIHGIASYNSMQSSLNALVIADYLFYLILKVKELESDEHTES